MSKKFHQRVFILNYSEDCADLPAGEGSEASASFYKAVAMLLLWGMRGAEQEDTVQLVTVSMKPDEVVAAYHPALVAQDRREDGSLKYIGTMQEHVDTLMRVSSEKAPGARPYVIGAVKHSDGTYGLHS